MHELLAGRLDRLGEAKEIAQAAAVIGREVPRDILARVCQAQFGTSDEVLDEALQLLVSAGILTEGEEGRRAGAFTHALLRDAAYASLLREPCRALHLHVARAFLEADPDVATARPELVAAHLVEGGDPLASLPHWLAAARRALARSALTEATRLLGRAMAALDALPRTRELIEQRLEVMTLLGPALMALKGEGSAEAAQLYAAANALCQELPRLRAAFPDVFWGWWRVSRDYFAHAGPRQRAALAGAPATRSGIVASGASLRLGERVLRGNYARCCAHADAGLGDL